MKKCKIFAIMIALLAGLTACGKSSALFEQMGKDTVKWAKNYDQEKPPSLTIYIEEDGGAGEPVKITEDDMINDVFEALSEVTILEKAEPDSKETTYIFTFSSDGKKQNFTLLGEDYVKIGKSFYEAEDVRDVLKAAELYEKKQSRRDDDDRDAPVVEEPQQEPEPEPDGQEPSSPDIWNGYAVFRSDKMDFSFLYDAAYTAQIMDGGGAVVYIGGTQSIPYLEVIHVVQGPDAQEYLEEQLYKAQMELGDLLVDCGDEPAAVDLEEKDMLGIYFSFNDSASGGVIEIMCFAENLPSGGIAVYQAAYQESDMESALNAVSDVIASFQPSADYYSNGGTAPSQPEPQQEPEPRQQSGTSYQLEKYEGKEFTMQLPKGWIVETGGAYAGFCFRAYDPNNVDVQIFFYGELGPYFRSESGKAMYLEMSQGMDTLSKLPVLSPGTLKGCLNSLDDYQKCYDEIMPTKYTFAKVQNLSNVSEKPVTTFLSNIATSETMLIANLTSTTGKPCIGIFQGSIADANPYGTDETDYSPSRVAMDIFGVIAPEEQFDAVSDILIQSLCSFRFTEEYIKEGINYTNSLGQSAMEYSRQNNELMDRVNQNFTDYIRSN